MSDAGYFAVSRRLFEHDFFAAEPFTEREAWLWLIREAAWKRTSVRVGRGRITLERGQCAASTRFLAGAWQWSHSRVVRYLKRLENGNMILSEIGTLATQITICNYNDYQGPNRETGTVAEQSRNKQEEDKPFNQIPKEDVTADAVPAPYAFEGKTIKLNQKNFDQWVEAHPNLSLMSELFALDEWAGQQKAMGKSWFSAVAGALAKKQRDFNERIQTAKANRETGGGVRRVRDGRI